MCRILRSGGLALVTVWAKEQKYNNKESFYISQKKSAEKVENEPEPSVHKFGREFEKKDLFVAWHLKTGGKGKKAADLPVPTLSEKEKKEKVFLRFYHVFENNELESLFQFVPEVKIVESYYEQGNWCVVFEKI